MSTSTKNGGRRGLYLAAAATAVLLVLGVGFLVAGRPKPGPPMPSASSSAPEAVASTPTPSSPPAAAATGSTAQAAAATSPDLGPILPASDPVSLRIPSIGVRASQLVGLAYTKAGELEVPKDFNTPGWFTPGPSPGQLGPAVIAGHVDSKAGPAVFFKLGALKPGAKVFVGRKDGTTATFSVDRVERYPKDQFPTDKVYGPTNRAELRLITCGGTFDRAIGHYRDNIVAYAHLVA